MSIQAMVPHTYDSISTYNFNWENVPENCIVFLDPGEESVPGPPSGFDNSATYVNMDGNTLGMPGAIQTLIYNLHLLFPYQVMNFQLQSSRYSQHWL